MSAEADIQKCSITLVFRLQTKYVELDAKTYCKSVVIVFLTFCMSPLVIFLATFILFI